MVQIENFYICSNKLYQFETMAKKKTIKTVSPKTAKPLSSSTNPPASKRKPPLFAKENYILMIVGVLLIVIGFIFMAGGAQSGNEFDYDEIYSPMRITIAPIIVVLGFIVEVVALFYRSKSMKNQPTES
jgi:uncharacterized integral membrane protein